VEHQSETTKVVAANDIEARLKHCYVHPLILMLEAVGMDNFGLMHLHGYSLAMGIYIVVHY